MTDEHKPIQPSDIKPEHYSVSALHDMVESWRGVPRGKVPAEVKMVAWMFRTMESQLQELELIDDYLNSVQNQMKRLHRAELKRLDDVRDRVGMANLHLHILKDHVRQLNKAPPAKPRLAEHSRAG